MRRGWLPALAVFLGSFTVFIGFWVAAFELADRFGFNLQVTPQYGFSSGVGPMILAALGFSTLAAGLWHSLNCHASGCWNLGRHRVNGTPWCNSHHEEARQTMTDSQRLDRIIELLEQRPGEQP